MTKAAASVAVAVPGAVQTELRALMLFDHLPGNHETFAVTEDGSKPHLRRGEYAVIDRDDREPQHGELYLIQYQGGMRRREIVQVTMKPVTYSGDAAPSPAWWCGDLRGYRKTDETMFGCPIFAGVSDGPYRIEYLRSKLIGRVVGFALTSLGKLIAPEAGYENEAAGNAAFDPGEYLDTLITAGWRPSIYGGTYFEATPEQRVSDEHDAAVLAVRWKYVAASTALARVKAECVRRGLVDDRRAA